MKRILIAFLLLGVAAAQVPYEHNQTVVIPAPAVQMGDMDCGMLAAQYGPDYLMHTCYVADGVDTASYVVDALAAFYASGYELGDPRAVTEAITAWDLTTGRWAHDLRVIAWESPADAGVVLIVLLKPDL